MNLVRLSYQERNSAIDLFIRFTVSVSHIPVLPLNHLGLPELPFYRTKHVCQVVGLKPCTLRWRLEHDFYPGLPARQDAPGRPFTTRGIEELIKQKFCR